MVEEESCPAQFWRDITSHRVYIPPVGVKGPLIEILKKSQQENPNVPIDPKELAGQLGVSPTRIRQLYWKIGKTTEIPPLIERRRRQEKLSPGDIEIRINFKAYEILIRNGWQRLRLITDDGCTLATFPLKEAN